jgi:phosphopantothenoylcysteine decarboxylase
MPSYILQLRKELNAKVYVMLTKNASRFVTPYALRLHSGNEVFADSYEIGNDILVPHLKLTQEADVMIVMPATANVIAKAAYGICDDLISTAIVATKGPIVFVPSMNANMWFDRTVQQNTRKLIEYGYYVLEPRNGTEIEGIGDTYGVMPALSDIILVVKQILNNPICPLQKN